MTQESQRLVRSMSSARSFDLAKAAIKLNPCTTCAHYRPLSSASCAKTGGKSSFVGCSGHRKARGER